MNNDIQYLGHSFRGLSNVRLERVKTVTTRESSDFTRSNNGGDYNEWQTLYKLVHKDLTQKYYVWDMSGSSCDMSVRCHVCGRYSSRDICCENFEDIGSFAFSANSVEEALSKL